MLIWIVVLSQCLISSILTVCLCCRFKVFADYEAYIKCQDKVSALYKVSMSVRKRHLQSVMYSNIVWWLWHPEFFILTSALISLTALWQFHTYFMYKVLLYFFASILYIRWMMLYCTALSYTICYTLLYYIIVYCAILYFTITWYCTMLYYTLY